MISYSYTTTIFHPLLERILKGLPRLHYIDDILVSNKTEQDLHIPAELVLCELQKLGFKVKKERMQWCRKTVVYLGHVVTEGSYSMQPVLEKPKEHIPRIEGRLML